jgi:hypothetical protein
MHLRLLRDYLAMRAKITPWHMAMWIDASMPEMYDQDYLTSPRWVRDLSCMGYDIDGLFQKLRPADNVEDLMSLSSDYGPLALQVGYFTDPMQIVYPTYPEDLTNCNFIHTQPFTLAFAAARGSDPGNVFLSTSDQGTSGPGIVINAGSDDDHAQVTIWGDGASIVANLDFPWSRGPMHTFVIWGNPSSGDIEQRLFVNVDGDDVADVNIWDNDATGSPPVYPLRIGKTTAGNDGPNGTFGELILYRDNFGNDLVQALQLYLSAKWRGYPARWPYGFSFEVTPASGGDDQDAELRDAVNGLITLLQNQGYVT